MGLESAQFCPLSLVENESFLFYKQLFTFAPVPLSLFHFFPVNYHYYLLSPLCVVQCVVTILAALVYLSHVIRYITQQTLLSNHTSKRKKHADYWLKLSSFPPSCQKALYASMAKYVGHSSRGHNLARVAGEDYRFSSSQGNISC